MSGASPEKPLQFGDGHTTRDDHENNFVETKPRQLMHPDCIGTHSGTNQAVNGKNTNIVYKPQSNVIESSKDENRRISPRVTSKNETSMEAFGIFKIGKTLDANRYATKKTIAQGMLDIALLTANASQLKYILQVGKAHEFYTLMLTLISLSIGLQAAVGILFIVVGGLDINKPRDQWAANIINDIILIGVFVISLINVVISAFGMEFSNKPPELLAYKRHVNELESLPE